MGRQKTTVPRSVSAKVDVADNVADSAAPVADRWTVEALANVDRELERLEVALACEPAANSVKHCETQIMFWKLRQAYASRRSRLALDDDERKTAMVEMRMASEWAAEWEKRMNVEKANRIEGMLLLALQRLDAMESAAKLLTSIEEVE